MAAPSTPNARFSVQFQADSNHAINWKSWSYYYFSDIFRNLERRVFTSLEKFLEPERQYRDVL
jgi:hypothetical protein